MTKPRLVYVIGIPGSGKTSAVNLALSMNKWERGATPLSPFKHEHLLYPRHLKVQKAIYLGWRSPLFGGTDVLPMNIQPKVVAWLKHPPADLVVGEGDRLANVPFFKAMREVYQLTVVYLDTPPEIAQQRRLERNTHQNEAWVKGRITKVRNLAPQVDLVLSGTGSRYEVAESLAPYLIPGTA